MRLEVSHRILVMGPDLGKSMAHALRFLERTPLVQYDSARAIAAESCPGTDSRFWPWLEEGIAANRQVLAKLFADLRAAGTRDFQDLLHLPQGFQSKIIHTAAHILDGFFGIDSVFYNLAEDSHWLSETLRNQITAAPEEFWLIKLVATLEALEHGSVSSLRSFEK
ncbi:hypothetical protein ACUUL3_14685 [Thiovibrio sp. JS02]